MPFLQWEHMENRPCLHQNFPDSFPILLLWYVLPPLPICCVYNFHSLNLRLAYYLCPSHCLHPNQGQLTWMHRRELGFSEYAIPRKVSRRQRRNAFELASNEFVSQLYLLVVALIWKGSFNINELYFIYRMENIMILNSQGLLNDIEPVQSAQQVEDGYSFDRYLLSFSMYRPKEVQIQSTSSCQ